MNVSVLLGGCWGTALAIVLSENGHRTALWQFFPELAHRMASTRENPDALPGVHIPESILISPSLETVLEDCDMIVFALPSEHLRKTVQMVAQVGPEPRIAVSGIKSIEPQTFKRMSEIVIEELGLSPNQVVALSGPSHAEEVSQHIPTTVVAACPDLETARMVQSAFMTPTFRVYTNEDVVGVELGGSLKNVVALAAGICDGLGFGDNTKGALITRGLAEISRLGKAMGARGSSFAGLSGLGDLVTTCISRHSRNRYVGEQLGKGKPLAEVLEGMVQVAEGVRTTESAFGLSQKLGVEMPIINQVYDILYLGKDPKDAVREVMNRGLKPELDT